MTRRRTLTFIFAALAALLLTLWLKRRAADDTSPPQAAQAPSEDKTSPAPEAAAAPPATDPVTPGNSLQGLRRLTEEVALSRGWRPKEDPPGHQLVKATLKKMNETRVTLNLSDTPLVEFLDDLTTTYGIQAKLDPDVPPDGHTVSFRVTDLAADQAIDLILKMADLAYRIDENGVLCVTTKQAMQRPIDPQNLSARQIVERLKPKRVEEPAARPKVEPEWKSRRQDISIVHKPLTEAIAELLFDAGLGVDGWSTAARAAAESAPRVSLVGEDLVLGEALEELLSKAQLSLRASSWATYVVTKAEEQASEQEERDRLAWQAAEEKKEADRAAEDARDLAGLRARDVRLEGDFLTLSMIAGQLAGQLGIRIEIDPHLADCPVRWESDGMTQKLGESSISSGKTPPSSPRSRRPFTGTSIGTKRSWSRRRSGSSRTSNHTAPICCRRIFTCDRISSASSASGFPLTYRSRSASARTKPPA